MDVSKVLTSLTTAACRKPIVHTMSVPNKATYTWLCLMIDLYIVTAQTDLEVLKLKQALGTKDHEAIFFGRYLSNTSHT